MDRTVARYAKAYRRSLLSLNASDIEGNVTSYTTRLSDMYASQAFARYNVYPSTDVVHVFAVIAMSLELRRHALSDDQIIEAVNAGFSARRNFFARLLGFIDLLPNAYQIAKAWNVSDHEKRVRDKSLTYDYFDVSVGKVEYRISRCVYVEMFEHYGIRSLCKIFCMTDTTSYEHLRRHVRFVRHSDLASGTCCHDEIIDRRHAI